MSCDKCANIIERTDIPHVIRKCEGCGRSLHVYEPGKHGIGIPIREGDQFVIPADWLKLSLNPLKSTGQFYKGGLQWYAELIYLDGLPNKKDNDDEGFWQIKLKENAYAISQIFAVPLLFIKDSAYVGGMNIDRKSAKFVDYLFALESSREAVLVEIKTPVTKLLGTKYRGTCRPSQELTGSLMQVLDYRGTLMKDLRSVTEGTNYTLNAFSPKCVVIVGNGSVELADEEKRTAFELFRANSKDVEIVTYDELFRKLDILASLFTLTRTS